MTREIKCDFLIKICSLSVVVDVVVSDVVFVVNFSHLHFLEDYIDIYKGKNPQQSLLEKHSNRKAETCKKL